MRILLLEHPREVRSDCCNHIANTPLSSCLLTGYNAGILKEHGHEVEIVEGFLEKLSYKEIKAIIQQFKPELIGVHMVYHWQEDKKLYQFLEEVKGEALTQYILAYGFYPSITYEEILKKCLAIDSIIVGETEFTIWEITNTLSKDHNHIGEGFLGLAQRTKTGAISCVRRPPITDLNNLPFPIRTEAMLNIGEVNILGSRGCYGGCTFCYINPFYGKGSLWRGRSPENILAEIDDTVSRFNKSEFYFMDPNFFGPGPQGQRRALKLASLLKSRKITFGIEARVNDIYEETIKALAEAGLRHILIGIESGSDYSLKRMNKRTTVEQNEKAIKILRSYGIEPNVGFIMFEPDSCIEDIRSNMEFLKRNKLLENLSITANVLNHHQILLQGTPAYGKLKAEGRLNVFPTSTYEGHTTIKDSKVALLATMMSQITNFLFIHMDEIWSGRTLEPDDANQKYVIINNLLVDTFEEYLSRLEKEEKLTKKAIDLQIEHCKNEIIRIL